MSIKSLTRLVTGAIAIPLLILFSHEGLQAQTDSECDRYARETTEREEGGVIRNCIANTQANLLETFNQFH